MVNWWRWLIEVLLVWVWPVPVVFWDGTHDFLQSGRQVGWLNDVLGLVTIDRESWASFWSASVDVPEFKWGDISSFQELRFLWVAVCQFHVFLWLEEGSCTQCRLVAVVSSFLPVNCFGNAFDCVRHSVAFELRKRQQRLLDSLSFQLF